MKLHSIVFCFVFLLYLINYLFVYFFIFMPCLNIFWSHQISSFEFNQLLCVNRHSIFICKFTSLCSVFVCLCNCAYLISNCCFSTPRDVISGLGWLDDRHGPSPIQCGTVTLFVHIDHLLCHCVYIHSNVHWQLVSLLRDGSLYCFCLLAESYESICQTF